MDAFTCYKRNGYYIERNLIDSSKIQSLLDAFESFKRRGGIYYSQSRHNWRSAQHDLDEYGLIGESLIDFTDLAWAPRLSKHGINILLSKEIEECLLKISGETHEFCMWQNMFFDKSTGTVDHIDSWYLDTDPMGQLIAAWVALEDIDGSGGEFHIYPGSHLADQTKSENWKYLKHSQFITWAEELRSSFKEVPVHLKAGDVLFWHPSLLHGSSNQKLEGHSRKSITAHYHPLRVKRGGRGTITKPSDVLYAQAVSETIKRNRRFGSLPIYATRKRISMMKALWGATKYTLNYKNQERMIMNRPGNRVGNDTISSPES